MSTTRDSDDNVAIDMTELIRVYGELKNDGSIRQQQSSKRHGTSTAAIKNDKDALIATLIQDLEEARERERWLKERIESLERAALSSGEVKNETKQGFWERLSQLFNKQGG